jgi:undecaprenyl-diphosphatase
MMLLNGAFLSRLDARDRALFMRWSASERVSRTWKVFWMALTHLGGAMCSILVASLPLRAEGSVGGAARHALLALVISHIIVQTIKRTVGRPRPSRATDCLTLVNEPDKFSFPSGHSAAAMSVAIAYAMAFPAFAPVLIPLALLVGASRVFLGVHYPGDVLIGQLIAAATAVLLR